jgi:hypothetical protein
MEAPYKVVQSDGRCWIETVATGVKSYDFAIAHVALLNCVCKEMNHADSI